MARLIPSLSSLQIATETELSGSQDAVSNTRYLADTTSNAITLNLPSNPLAGDVIIVVDLKGTFSTNELALTRNGNKIMGLDENLILDVDYASVTLQYINVSNGWVII